jgi:hypothetical protein
MGLAPRIPSRIGRQAPMPRDSERYRLRHRIENIRARLTDWRRIATRDSRGADLLPAAPPSPPPSSTGGEP